jgi:hypothetical protein
MFQLSLGLPLRPEGEEREIVFHGCVSNYLLGFLLYIPLQNKSLSFKI